jgi:hypothetical protein
VAAEPDLVASGVDHERAERDDRRRGRVPVGLQVARPAEQGVAAGGDLVGAHRQRDGVVGAGAEHLDPGPVAPGRFDAQQVAVGSGAEVLVERALVGAVERGVDHHHVGGERLGEDAGRHGVGRGADREPGGAQAGLAVSAQPASSTAKRTRGAN